MPRFLRRPGRFPRTVPLGRRPAAQQAIVRLRRAHLLLASGEYVDAALIFSELADEADRRQISRGIQLHLQAARAWLKAGEASRAIPRIEHGVDLLEKTGQLDRLSALGPGIVAELQAAGLAEDAARLQVRLDSFPQEQRGHEAGYSTPQTETLPSKCSSCGGIIRPDELEWIDQRSAVCSYCGSVLHRG
ncbi:MAG: hypothetical protein JXA97_05150 [Anaerolineales bacterium]|nr:hypothetical protein [Anaerolineales bacterium]